jgi:hypothetical protein
MAMIFVDESLGPAHDVAAAVADRERPTVDQRQVRWAAHRGDMCRGGVQRADHHTILTLGARATATKTTREGGYLGPLLWVEPWGMSTHGPTIFDPAPGCGSQLVPDNFATYRCRSCGQWFRSNLGYLVAIVPPAVAMPKED